jgi:hypothetical protein
MVRFPNSAVVLVFFLACCRTGGLCSLHWNQVLSSLRARDRYFSCVESSEFLLHARVWDGFWLLVDLWLDIVVLAFFLFRACESRKMCVDTWLDQYLLFWDVYPGNLIICLDFATRRFFGRRLEFVATILFRIFFCLFFFCGESKYMRRSSTL